MKKKQAAVEKPAPARLFSDAQRDAFLLILYAMALLYSNRWFTFIDDETLVLNAAARPIKATLALFASGVGQHHHPPLYDLLLHVWLRATGGAFDWLRVPSVLFFVAALWVLSRAAGRLGGPASSAAVILLGVLWPYGFHFGRLAVWYSFAFLIVSALTWAYLRYCDSPNPSAWLLVCLFGLLLVYTNYFGWAILAILAADTWWRSRGQSGTVRRLALSATGLIVLYAPLWRVLFHELSSSVPGTHSVRAMVLNAGFSVYSLLVSESVAPWFWRFGIPATLAVAGSFVLAFLICKGLARLFIVYGAILIAVMALAGILDTKRLLLVAPWFLLPFAVAVGTPDWPNLRRAFAVCLLVAAGIGWYGVYKRSYYAAPRFFEPWAQVANEAAQDARGGAGVVGNNPSFFFYLTYALKPGANGTQWSFAGVLPHDVQVPNVWSAEDWIAAGHPKPGGMFWVLGMPGPETGTPMAAAGDWLDHNCGDRNFRFMVPDLGYELKQKYFPQLGSLAWRIEVHQYDCTQTPAGEAPAGSVSPAH